MKHRIEVVVTLFLVLFTVGSCKIRQSEKEETSVKNNVLFIAIDDLFTSIGISQDMEGSFLKTIYPDAKVRQRVAARLTPNIDKLANEGRQFTNAMTQSPLCGPSRTGILTGIPAHASGYYGHGKNFRAYKTLKNVVTLPQYLKSNGYFTAGLGKIFHRNNTQSLTDEGDWSDERFSWSKWISSGGGADLEGGEHSEMSPGKDAGHVRFGASDGLTEKARDWQNSNFTATLLRTGQATIDDKFTKKDETIVLPSDKPFFLASGIFRPHLPFYAPQKYFDMFPTAEMKIDEALLELVTNDIKDLPEAGLKWTQLTNGMFYEILSRGEEVGGKAGRIEAWKQCVQAYLACVAFADDCVGEILNGLENSPYKNNTAVVLWSDHGFFMGGKARIAKQCLWREALNSNLIIKLPNNQKQRGVPSKEYVQLTDMYATIASLCGLEKPKHVMGEDLSDLVKNPNAKLKRQYAYSTYMEGNHAIYNDQYKYIRYKNGDIEFYDMKADINEYKNLAKNAEYKHLITSMNAELNRQLQIGLQNHYVP